MLSFFLGSGLPQEVHFLLVRELRQLFRLGNRLAAPLLMSDPYICCSTLAVFNTGISTTIDPFKLQSLIEECSGSEIVQDAMKAITSVTVGSAETAPNKVHRMDSTSTSLTTTVISFHLSTHAQAGQNRALVYRPRQHDENIRKQ